MHSLRINRLSRNALLVLSMLALASVLAGYFAPAQPDEGALAHIFQLSIVALVPILLLFLLTADWKQSRQATRELMLPGFALTTAFVALYFLEHRQ
jgi:uncharacterized membrane protein YozB (DUF420 family)